MAARDPRRSSARDDLGDAGAHALEHQRRDPADFATIAMTHRRVRRLSSADRRQARCVAPHVEHQHIGLRRRTAAPARASCSACSASGAHAAGCTSLELPIGRPTEEFHDTNASLLPATGTSLLGGLAAAGRPAAGRARRRVPAPSCTSAPSASLSCRNGLALVGSGGTSSGSSGRTRRGVISTISSVCSARSALLLNSEPMIGSLLRIGIAERSFLRDVVEQAGNRERLAVAQLDVGLGAARRQGRDAEAAQA